MPIEEYDVVGVEGAKGRFFWGDDVAPVSDLNKRILARWELLRAPNQLPAFSELDLVEFAELAPAMCIVDCLEDCTSFHFRMIGTDIVKAYGMDQTGKVVDENSSGEHEVSFRKLIQAACAAGGPVLTAGKGMYDVKGKVVKYRDNETIILPMSDGSGAVTQIVMHLHFL